MSVAVFLLWLSTIPLCLHATTIPPPTGFFLSCGSSEPVNHGGLTYTADDAYINTGNKTTLKQPDLHPLVTSLRFFPDTSARKYCYNFPVIKGAKFLVKTTYYYGGFDGGNDPPVFDQIIDGTRWTVVNTTEDYRNGLSSFYEIVVAAHGKTLSVCLARNKDTVSSPFVSAIELDHLEDSMYNATNFEDFALSTVARNSFGSNGDTISFPDDKFNRFWQAYTDDNPIVESHSNVTSSEFWNMPPEKALMNSITTSRGKTLTVYWPPFPLPSSNYYIALYFQDNRSPSPYSWRVFSVAVNGKEFYNNVNVTSNGVTIYSPQWPLSGQTEVVLTPASDSKVGPIISAGEIFQQFPIGRRTVTRDVVVMDDFAQRLTNAPPDWRGDPCLPEGTAWTGVTCSFHEKFARVTSLNLTGFGLSGTLPDSFGTLTAVDSIWLGGNHLTGNIPELGGMQGLQTLHLEDNQFEGPFPNSLGDLKNLREAYLQNNKLTGSIADTLKNKDGLKIEVHPGNPDVL